MKTSVKLIHWIPRILCIMAILFIMMFSADCFDGQWKAKELMICLVMHNIPAFILTLILVIAWKWEFIGGIIFVLLGVGFSPFIYTHNYAMNQSVWISISILLLTTFPFVLVGILFLVSYRLKKKNQFAS
jgi:hypothetical protein